MNDYSQNQEEGVGSHQKLAIAFIAGLLLGALSVWVYFGQTNMEETLESEEGEEMMIEEGEEETASVSTAGEQVGTLEVETRPQPTASEADIVVSNQPSGNSVMISELLMPQGGGWVVVHEHEGGALKNALGAKYFEEGSWSGTVSLLRNTVVGQTYFVVIYEDDGDRRFSMVNDRPFVDLTTGQVIRKQFTATTR